MTNMSLSKTKMPCLIKIIVFLHTLIVNDIIYVNYEIGNHISKH